MAPQIEGEELTNRILLALSPAVLQRLGASLTRATLARGDNVARPGDKIQNVIFINRGLVSVIKRMKNGDSVEVAARGIEGVTTPEAIFGVETATLESFIQLPLSGFAIGVAALRCLKSELPELGDLFQRYIHIAVDQIAQTAACNRLHTLARRCSRWLLVANDAARSDTVGLTHEFLATMLGVHRPAVSTILDQLEQTGLIDISRGEIRIKDRKGLEASSCECYATIRAEIDRQLPTRHP